MRKTIKLALSAALVLGATSAMATNGSTLIGVGAQARGMGGTAIGVAHGAESALANPALITSIEKDHEISFGGTLFMPNVSANMGAGASDSAADMSMIPAVSLATKINDNLFVGVGMWGTAGMGVDYREASGMTANMNMVTNLQLMQFGVPIAYTANGFSLGVTPVLQYGALDINYDMTSMGGSEVGEGVSQDLAFGYNLGLSYEIANLTIGASYKSQIDMEYIGQLSSATAPFVAQGIFPAVMKDKLSTPQEMGVGASYKFANNTIALDYKKIKWSEANGYKDFGWEDQNVYSLGYEYAVKSWALRAGYNYSESPIKDIGAMKLADIPGAMTANNDTNPANMPSYLGGNAMNMFNLLGFPAVVEKHYTVGGTYNLSKSTSIDLAYVYAPKTTVTMQTMPADMMINATGVQGQDGQPDTDMTTTVEHSQQSVSFQVKYKF